MRHIIIISLVAILLYIPGIGSYGQDIHMGIDQKLRSFQLDKKNIEIYIDKTEHTLSLKAGRIILKEYKCVFGGDPTDDKKYEGDKCTPEGEFHIVVKHPHAQWDKFMLIDYPTRQSVAKYEANRAHGKIPPGATIGGGVGIHGVPWNKPYLIDKGINWTLGCISLSNADIDEIYQYVGAGTKVTIAK
jgi:murein L,D-transpeptidase YafK